MSAVLQTRQQFAIRPFDAALGAEVLGLDLSLPLDGDDVARLHRAHLMHHVLVFRDQHITPAQQVDFSRRFGPLQIHVLRQFQLPTQPEVLIVSNIRENGQPIGLGDAGHFWHSDLSYKETPSLGSMLHAQELPGDGSGDTLFANQHTAWEQLPAHLRRAVEGAQAEHSYLARYADLQKKNPWRPNLTQAQIDEVKPVVHPVVRTHPETGRTRPEHIYRHQWQPHDMVFWDNRSLMHLAAGCPDDQRRKLYRTTIEGDVPF
jgi:taurine dioxygenase